MITEYDINSASTLLELKQIAAEAAEDFCYNILSEDPIAELAYLAAANQNIRLLKVAADILYKRNELRFRE